MNRYYVSAVTSVDIGGGDMGYVPALYDYGANMVIVTAADNPTWALVLVKADDHALMQADPRNAILPESTLDAAMADLPAELVASTMAKISALGVDTTGLASVQAYRDLVRAIGRQLEAAFDENLLVVH